MKASKKVLPYKKPFSVWELIKSIVPNEELPIIQSAIGESLVESCIDLKNEIEVLLQILKDVNCSKEFIFSNKLKNTLPESPRMKEMLKMEIKMLAENLNFKSNNQYSSLSESNIKTIEYISENIASDRPLTPARLQENSGASSSSPVKLKDVKRNINVCDVDRVLQILRDSILKECNTLEQDIKFLQESIEQAHTSNHQRSVGSDCLVEPTMLQLKEARRNLENEILHTCRKSASTRLSSAPSSSSKKSKTPDLLATEKVEVQETSCCKRFKVRECWVEPSWTNEMNDHSPIEGRPSSRDLNTIQKRLDTLNIRSSKSSGLFKTHSLDDIEIHKPTIKRMSKNNKDHTVNNNLNKLLTTRQQLIKNGTLLNSPISKVNSSNLQKIM